MSFEILTLLFAGAVTLHNAEEAVWLPGWTATPGRFGLRVAAPHFRFVVAALTALAWAVAGAARYGEKGSAAVYLVSGYALAMLVNAVVPHAVATMVLRRYAPGTGTAVLLNVPAAVMLLCTALADGWITARTFAWAGPLCVLALLASLPLLFGLGRRLLPV